MKFENPKGEGLGDYEGMYSALVVLGNFQIVLYSFCALTSGLLSWVFLVIFILFWFYATWQY